MSQQQIFRVRDLTQRYAVNEHIILRWIHNGELRAIDVSSCRGGRPKWRITAEALAAFEESRIPSPPPEPTRQRRKKNPSATVGGLSDEAREAYGKLQEKCRGRFATPDYRTFGYGTNQSLLKLLHKLEGLGLLRRVGRYRPAQWEWTGKRYNGTLLLHPNKLDYDQELSSSYLCLTVLPNDEKQGGNT